MTCLERLQELMRRLNKDRRGGGLVDSAGDDVLKCVAVRHDVTAEERAYDRWIDRNVKITRTDYSRSRDEYRELRRNDMRLALKLDAIRAAA